MGTRAPRVVILVENLPVPLDRRVWLEALALRDDDWQVVVIGPQGGHGMRRLRERIGDILVLRYPQREASGLAGYLVEYVPSMVFSLAWFIWARLSGPVDVVHGCNPPDLFWLFGRLGRLWGARYVFDLHDPNPELSLTKFGRRGLKGRALHRLTLALESASFRTADLVLTVNDTCKAIAIDRGGMPESNVIVLRNAPNTAEHRRLSVGIEPEGRGVGYVGVMGTHDGLDVLLDAWAIVKQEGDLDDARLDLVGDGPARDGLERQVADSGLASSVRFWGFLPPSEFVPILARTMVGVSPDLPTPFNDLSSMVKVIDYLAIGRGCVAFDLTETKRLGGEALMIARSNDPPGLASALIEVLRAPAEARRLGDLARGRIDGLALDWEPYRQALVKAYAPFKQRPSKSSG